MAYTTIPKSTDYFNTKLYTGNAGTQTITGVGFQPDWTWIKNRATQGHHVLTDAVRGANKQINTNRNNAELSLTTQLTAFTSDGFSVGAGTEVNGNGNNMVSWNWKANGQGSSNTDGTINSTYTSANTTSGFSIVSYTGNGSAGATVGHGLGQTPGVFITKRLSGTSSWGMYHQSTGAGGFMELNSTNALQSNAAYFNNTAPTSSVFSIGTDSINNTSGSTYIAYCFADIQGYSKFGSYVGNGNADGSFIFCGFKPAFVMIKNATQSGDRWIIHDNKRDVDNGCNHRLFPDGDIAESTSTTSLDFLSNGFKQRTDAGTSNTNGQTYIFMAFAEAPLVSSNGVAATAR